ncbi:MAG TPA: class I SAM-dependent methyltransferase [Candidatus Dormibacteraeota bacterium]|nr:class I SAM-dependent methyltransferase [Candidatus Dormibacteraeota bacterium]
MPTDPLDVWRDALADWAIPEHILAAAPESPWLLPRDLFARRADAQIERPTGIALARAAEALPAGGTVLDVGAGAGAASLPLTGATRLIAVDSEAGMIAELRSRAARRGLQVVSIVGRWPDVSPRTPIADVVVCSHVLYNIPDIAPFVVALGEHAGRRVVLEITARHPLSALSPLWRRFHGIERPERPTWQDASAAIRAAGIQPRAEVYRRPPGAAVAVSFEAFVRMTRIRLCLAPEREPEVAAALVERGADRSDPTTWTPGADDLVVLWWDV